MSLKHYIFSSINTKGAQDSDKFATIRLKSLRVKNMAIKGELDGPAPSRTNEQQTVVEQPPAAVKSTADANGTPPANRSEEFKCAWFFSGKGLLKILSYITVEPLMLCWLLPSCFLFIAVENLALEKVGFKLFFFVNFICFPNSINMRFDTDLICWFLFFHFAFSFSRHSVVPC